MFSPAQCTGAHPPARLNRFRLSARRKWRWLTSTFRRFGQKCGRGNSKRVRQSLQCIGRDVFRAALDTTDIRSIDLGRQRQSLLRQALFNAELAEIPTNDFAHIHREQEGNTNGLTIDGLTVPYSMWVLLQVLCKPVTKLQGD